MSLIELCRVFNHEWYSFWVYLQIPLSRYIEFLLARQSGDLVLEEYGTILEMGPGETPPKEVQERMEHLHPINHKLEEELKNVFFIQNASEKD